MKIKTNKKLFFKYLNSLLKIQTKIIKLFPEYHKEIKEIINNELTELTELYENETNNN